MTGVDITAARQTIITRFITHSFQKGANKKTRSSSLMLPESGSICANYFPFRHHQNLQLAIVSKRHHLIQWPNKQNAKIQKDKDLPTHTKAYIVARAARAGGAPARGRAVVVVEAVPTAAAENAIAITAI
jgi:hypothetical protein